MLKFEPGRVPVAPRDAASVIIAREREARVELFCVKRHQQSGFMGGAVVFPGGKVDPADGGEAWTSVATEPGDALRAWLGEGALAFGVAALRECFEEAALLPTAGGDLDDDAVKALRQEHAEGGSLALAALLGRQGLRLDVGRLQPLSRWVTPEAETRRFDARFFLLAAPEGQRGAHDKRETTESFWSTPAELLQRWTAGEIFLAPPTQRTIELFRDVTTLGEARAVAARQRLTPTCPHLVLQDGLAVLALPGDPLYPTAHPPPEDPDAPTRFVLEGGRFVGHRRA